MALGSGVWKAALGRSVAVYLEEQQQQPETRGTVEPRPGLSGGGILHQQKAWSLDGGGPTRCFFGRCVPARTCTADDHSGVYVRGFTTHSSRVIGQL